MKFVQRLFFFFLLFITNLAIGQTFADKGYYLVDELALDSISATDSVLVERSLKEFHQVTDDTAKVNAVNHIVEESWDNNLWPMYNQWVYEFVESQLSHEKNQDPKVQRRLKTLLTDALNNIGYIYDLHGNPDLALEHYKKAIKLDKELGNNSGVGYTLNNIGLIYKKQGQITLCIEYYEQSIKLFKEANESYGLALTYNNIASIYDDQGDIVKALEYFHKSLSMRDETDKMGKAISLANIASIYIIQGDTNLGLEYFTKSLGLGKELGDMKVVANALANMAGVYRSQGNYAQALDTLKKGLAAAEKAEYKEGIGNLYNHMGYVYQAMNQLDMAFDHFSKSQLIYTELDDKRGMAMALNCLASIALEKNQLDGKKGAHQLAKQSLVISRDIGFPDNIKNSAHLLSKIYAKQRKGMDALEMYQLYISMRDSIHNDETKKASYKQQAQYEYEKQKAVDDKEHEKLIAIEQEEKARQRIIIYASSGGLLLLLILIVVVFRSYKNKQRDNVAINEKNEQLNQYNEEILAQSDQIENQNTLLYKQNHDILSSIQYAKKIQESILPTDEKVRSALPESFVFYKAKDIVSGDFYWLETVQDKVIWAAVDCTGHGVPGAFMSIMGATGLQKVVVERAILKPSDILRSLKDHVINSVSQTKEGNEVMDGMDIALCSWDPKTNTLEYSGAYNPLYIIRKGSNEIEITKATKRPIGRFFGKKEVEFQNHSYKINKGDIVYVFTDGYADQFGGDRKWKFTYNRMRELMLAMKDLPMAEQRLAMQKAHEDWVKAGNEVQLDDICVIGVRF